MINGQTSGEYLDLDKYSVFWERAAALEAPVYLHPGNPVDRPAVYAGHDELWGAVCSWTFETAAHALRLVFAGVFERYPRQSSSSATAGKRCLQPVAIRQPLAGLQQHRPRAGPGALVLHPAQHRRHHVGHVL